MTKIYFLKNFEEKFKGKIEDSALVYPLDYKSLYILKNNKIKFDLIDNFLNDNDRKELFQTCRNIWNEFTNISKKELEYNNFNVLQAIDRNEIQEYLMELYSISLVIKKIIDKFSPEVIFAPKSIIEIIKQQKYDIKLIEFYDDQEGELSFDYVNVRKKIGIIKINSKISRSQFKTIKNFLQIFNKIAYWNNNFNNNLKKILLLEFDPELYENLIIQIKKCGYVPVLVNFRKPAISSMASLNSLKRTQSVIFNPKMLRINKNELNGTIKKICPKIINFIKQNNDFLEFNIYELKLSSIIKKQIIKILEERLDEYIKQINYFKFLDKRNDIVSSISLNLSGETEKIFSKIKKNTPLILLQHGFSNYHDFNSYSDTLDDYDLLREKIAVWGNSVRDYLISNSDMQNNNIIVSGSPRHDDFEPSKKTNITKKRIVITPRPLIMHVEGTKLELHLRYEKVLKDVILYLKKFDDVEIVFKLHPQQNPHNEIIKSIIRDLDPKIPILQDESIKKILENSYLLINISPDNLDASTVVFESMLMNTPIVNIRLQNNSWIYDFEKTEAVLTFDYDSNYQIKMSELITDEKKYNEQVGKLEKFLEFYLVNRKCASENLIKSLL
jgi:hypothetical protein